MNKEDTMKYLLSFYLIFLIFSCTSSTDTTPIVVNKECKENNCYNHGQCLDSGTCVCDDGYEAPYCLDCKQGYMLSNENKCVPPEEGMMYIVSTNFLMGCDKTNDSKCDENIEKKHNVHLSSFQMDKYEITVSKYKECVDNNACTAPTSNTINSLCNYGSFSRLEHPINCVTWQQASDYCSFVNKKLPSEAQWELAATGNSDYKIYPWGNKTPSCEYAIIYDQSSGCDRGRTAIVGSKEIGKSPYGIYDLAGNVWEWTIDTYDENFYSNSITNNPINTAPGTYKVVRGGTWDLNLKSTLRNKYRGYAIPEKFSPSIGFRCVK
jgi:formylglycine-generating enzyme required for sulfatase activity